MQNLTPPKIVLRGRQKPLDKSKITTRKTNFDFENSDLENYKSENSNIYLEIQSIILALGKSPKDKSNRLNFVEDAVRGKQEQSEPNLGS